MATLGDLLNKNVNSINTDADENSRPNAFVSALAGIGSGLFKIPEGFVSLGATLIDLGAGTDKAAEVEKFFAKINPFDEMAEATTAGKITELITNIGVPGGIAFKAGSSLAKGALMAKKQKKYFDLGGDISKTFNKKLKGLKLTGSEKKTIDNAFSKGATGLEKTKAFGAGAGLGGLAEGIFVGDVEDAGTFGDLLGGPTKIERGTNDPQTEILNRLKFGLEGAGFTGLVGGIGKTISKVRNQSGTGKAITKPFDRWIDKWISRPLRSRGPYAQEAFDVTMKKEGSIARDRNVAENAMLTVDKIGDKLIKNLKKTTGAKVEENVQKSFFKETNDFLIGKKLKTNFKKFDEINVDDITGRPYKAGEGRFEDKKFIGKRLPLQFKIKDSKTGKVRNENLKTGEESFQFKFDEINPINKKNRSQAEINFRKKLKTKYGADEKDINNLLNSFKSMRGTWENLFTAYGKRLNPKALDEFETMIRGSLTEAMDRGYKVFKNNSGQDIATNYTPTKEILKAEASQIKKEFSRLTKNKVNLTDEESLKMADEIWQGSSLPKGVLLKGAKPGDVVFKDVPDFLKNSVASDLLDEKSTLSKNILKNKYIGRSGGNLSQLSPEGQSIVKRLLGKSENPMSTLVEGTANLSSQVRYNQWLDNLVIESNKLKKVWDNWDAKGRVGAEPRVPFLFKDSAEARKYTGGTGKDFQSISPPGSKDAIRGTPVGRYYDEKAFLKPVDDVEAARLNAKAEKVLDEEIQIASTKGQTLTKKQRNKISERAKEILNPIEGKFALNDLAEALKNSKESMKGVPAQIYQNLILYPKATAQMAKTILAPFTHVRNFLSAASFAAANGIVPGVNTADVRAAWNALQVAGPGTRKSNEFYQELLDLGVVNSQVQLGDLRKLLEDVDFGSTLNKIGPNFNGLNSFLKKLSTAKKGLQDAYTAEDDFWKIFTFLGEKGRLDKAYRNSGLRLGQEFTDMNGLKQIFNDEYLKREAANLVKNNVPNYAFVPEFIKGLRLLPVGNFVAFPAEIMRTGTNIVETALKEINYKTVINGLEVTPLKSRGYQRLLGMATMTTVLPAGAVAALQTAYDVSNDEIDAMRRYVADWSKNSTLLPFRGEDGKLEYIDFSHMNAYDTLSRPIQTVINAVNEGREDEDGIMGDFLLGLYESTKEIGSPFISEAIWTKALQDVSPILGRGGKDANGREIYNLEVDSLGDAVSKSVSHLIEAQAPFNWKQLKRLGLSTLPKDSKGRFNERGQEFDLGNEALGIAGMRRVKIDPQKSMTYKIGDYKRGIRASRNIFTKETLKGGRITPEEIVNSYIKSNESLFRVNREMYKDIKAAQVLGLSEEQIEDVMIKRGERKAFNALIDDEFRPYSISNSLQELFEINANNLGTPNSFDIASDALDTISGILSNTSMSQDFFPKLPNPFTNSIIPISLGPVGNIPADVANTSGFIGQGAINIPFTELPQDQQLEKLDKVFNRN